MQFMCGCGINCRSSYPCLLSYVTPIFVTGNVSSRSSEDIILNQGSHDWTAPAYDDEWQQINVMKQQEEPYPETVSVNLSRRVTK